MNFLYAERMPTAHSLNLLDCLKINNEPEVAVPEQSFTFVDDLQSPYEQKQGPLILEAQRRAQSGLVFRPLELSDLDIPPIQTGTALDDFDFLNATGGHIPLSPIFKKYGHET